MKTRPDDLISRVLDGPEVETVETHGSRVFLHARDVFKVKKPVRFPFLDYTTLDQRREACAEELRVNRRSSPDVYLHLRPILRGSDGEVWLGEPQAADAAPPADSEVVEWVVHMRRLPDAHRADVRLTAGTLGNEEIRRIAQFLVRFHGEVERDADPQGAGGVGALRRNVEENLHSLEPHARQLLGTEAAMRLRALHLEAMDGVEPILSRRVTEGYVVDGHGDFRLEHVYLDAKGEVTLLDALEFDRAFRVADVCADVAFLAMDLCSRGRTDLAEVFVAAYALETGDHELYAFVDFYMTYWALVRAKVDAARSEQLEADEADAALEHCSRKLFLASHLVEGAARGRAVVAVTGLIACGKSRVARQLGDALAAPVLSSDRVRKQRADAAPTESLGSEPYQGAYSEQATREVYQDLIERAEIVVRSGRPVVIDASFQDESARAELRSLAERLEVPHLFIQCSAPKSEIRARLERRSGREHHSDARAPLLEHFESQYPPWSGEDAEHCVTVDTTRPRDIVDQEVLQHVRALRRPDRRSLRVSIGRGGEPARRP